jgi:hypothetical protein
MKSLIRATIVLSLLSCFIATAQESAYKYEINKAYTYLLEGKKTVTQEFGGRKVNVNSEANAAFNLTITERLDNGGMKSKIDIQSAVVIVEGPDGMKTFGQDLAGKSIVFVMDRFGTVSEEDTSVISNERNSRELMNAMMKFIPYLPPGKAVEGESWSREREDTLGTDDAPIQIQQESDYEVEETVELNSFSCLKVTGKSESSYEGTVTQGTQELSLLGEAEGKGSFYYSKDQGIIVKLERNDIDESVVAQLNNPSQQMTMTTKGNVTIELVSE